MEIRGDLIFDVGVCNGDDSAYYLHKGFTVVGVEANPLLLPELRNRFAAEIAAGRYHLLGAAIAEQEGEAPFWICDDWPEWSSFDRSIASRQGKRHHQAIVPTLRFASLLDRFGTPFFCKIDIEGKDNLCLLGLRDRPRPPYLSIEHIRGDRQVGLLADLGYDRFKIVSQTTLRSAGAAGERIRARLPAPLRRALATLESRFARKGSDGAWTFPRGASGPFGEASRGPWIGREEAEEILAILDRSGDWSAWHDIHASFSDPALAGQG